MTGVQTCALPICALSAGLASFEDDRSALAELTKLIAQHRVNIVDTLYNRAYYGVNLGDTAIDITLETRGPEQVQELLEALTDGGYVFSRVI